MGVLGRTPSIVLLSGPKSGKTSRRPIPRRGVHSYHPRRKEGRVTAERRVESDTMSLPDLRGEDRSDGVGQSDTTGVSVSYV